MYTMDFDTKIKIKENETMPCEIVWEHKGVHQRLSGHLSTGELQDSVETVQADPRFDEIRYVINDFSAVTGHELDEQQLLELSAIQYGAQASNPRVWVVYVGADPELTRRLRSIQIDASQPAYRVALFDALPQARDWLERKVETNWCRKLLNGGSSGRRLRLAPP